MGRATVNLSDELEEKVEADLGYGDSKSAWVREAIKLRLSVDSMLDDADFAGDEEERREFVVEAVEAALSE